LFELRRAQINAADVAKSLPFQEVDEFATSTGQIQAARFPLLR